MTSAKILKFEQPENFSKRAVLAEIRLHMTDQKHPEACIEYVIYVMGLIIDDSGMGNGNIEIKDEEEFAESISNIRKAEKFWSKVNSSLLAELTIAHTRVWYLENGG